MMSIPIIHDDDSIETYPSITIGGDEWRRAWVRTSAVFGQWYVKTNDGFIELWHPSIKDRVLRVESVAVESITYG